MKTNKKVNIFATIFYTITAMALVAVIANPQSTNNNDIQATATAFTK